MAAVWSRFTRYTQGLILIMVSVLFFTWGILGANQVQNQTATILEGVQLQLQEAEAARIDMEHDILDVGHLQVCIWRAIVKPANQGQAQEALSAIRKCNRAYRQANHD